ncbi:MAG: type IV toxin-antitoxin system AbiEi family antitoxin domain-containing protein [Candidatus Pacearchaeota archaeon]
MGKIIYIGEIRKFFKENPIVSIASLKKFLGKKRNDYIYLIVNNLLKKGEIKRITRGYYTIHDDPSLAVFCFKPSYLGLQDALSVHELWEQETIPVVITSIKTRRGIRKVFNHNLLLRHLAGKYIFGFNYEKQGDFYFPYSDVEKTFIDMIYFKQPLDEETRKNFIERIDTNKLNSYLKAYPKRFRKKVLNILERAIERNPVGFNP